MAEGPSARRSELKLKSEKEQQDFLSLAIAAAREDDRRGAAAPEPRAHVSGPQSTQEQTPSATDSPRRTEDGGYAYVFNSAPYGHPSRNVLVKPACCPGPSDKPMTTAPVDQPDPPPFTNMCARCAR